MQLLQALGINQTFWFHLIIFLCTFFILKTFVFKPYVQAFTEREKKRTGDEEMASRLTQESIDLHHEFEKKNREINQEFRNIYEQARLESMREHDKLVSKAREESAKYLEIKRKEIENEINKAAIFLKKEIPMLCNEIVKKVMGKNA